MFYSFLFDKDLLMTYNVIVWAVMKSFVEVVQRRRMCRRYYNIKETEPKLRRLWHMA